MPREIIRIFCPKCGKFLFDEETSFEEIKANVSINIRIYCRGCHKVQTIPLKTN